MELVSVIVPVYNVEKYLNRCIESILNQSYKNFEVLLIDDGSTDSSGRLCDAFATKDKRVRVFHQDNEGISAVRNFGVKMASGDLIAFVDSDDWIDEHLLRDNIRYMVQENADMVFFGFYEVFNDHRVKHLPNIKNDSDLIKERFLTADLPVVPWNKLYKKGVFQGLEYPVGMKNEDYFLLPYIAINCKKIVYNSNAYYYYNKTNTVSIMSNISSLRSLYTEIILAKNYIQVCEENGFEEICIRNLIRIHKQTYKLFALNMINKTLEESEIHDVENAAFDPSIISTYYKKMPLVYRILYKDYLKTKIYIKLKYMDYRLKYKLNI